MPTYSQNLPLVPTEYIPIDYRHDAQFQLAQAQQVATNVAKVKSRYETMMDWDLTTTKAKEGFSTFMKNAETNLQKVAGMDMLVYDNAKQALDIFKPLTDVNGEYGYIVGDHAVTNKFKENENLIEKSKTENKGEQYNPAYETILSAQKALFAKEDNPNSWKNYYYNIEEYKPGTDLTKRLLELEKAYREQVGEGSTTEQVANGIKIITKDQSINADKYEEYLSTHLNDQEKQQLLLNKKAEYWSNLVAYASISDPAKKAEAYTTLKNNYAQVSNQQIDEQATHLKSVKEVYEKYKAQTPAENADMIKQLNEGISNVDKRLAELEGKRLTDSQLDSMIDPTNWVAGQNLYTTTFSNNELSKIAKSAAVEKISKTTEKDDAYWEQMKLNVEMYKAGLQLAKDGSLVQDPGVQETDRLMTEERLNSPEKFGKYLYDKDAKDIATDGATMKIIDVATGENISERYDKIKGDLSGMTWAEAMENGYVAENNSSLNTLVGQLKVPDGKGGVRNINPNVDNANYVLATLKQSLSKKENIDYLISTTENNPRLRKGLNDAVNQLELANSKAAGLNKNFQKVYKSIVSEIEAPDGTKFLDEANNYKINNPEQLREALTDFSNKHKGIRYPWTGADKEYERIMKKEGPEGTNSFWSNPYFARLNATMNTIGSNAYGYTPLGWATGALGLTHSSYTTKMDVDETMDKFYAKYGETQGDTAFLGYSFRKTRPISKDEGVTKAFESRVSTYALNSTERPELNKLIKDYTNMVSDVYEGKQGYGVQFTTNISEAEGKTFLEAYNTMAGNDTSGMFEDAGSVQEAVTNLNNYFKTTRIPTRAIDPNDKKYNIDQNLKFASNNRQLTSVDISPEDLVSLYGVKDTKDVVVGITNKRAAQLGFDDMDLGMNIHYLRPLIKNGLVQRDATGNVQLEHIYGKDILDLEVKKLVSGGYSLNDAIDEAKKRIMTNVTDYVTHYGTEARNYLDFIKYLNTQGKNITSLKDIPAETLNQYLSK